METNELENDVMAIGGNAEADGAGAAAKPGEGGAEVDYKAKCEELKAKIESMKSCDDGRVRKLDGELKAAQAKIAELEQKNAREAALGALPDELKDVPDEIKNTALAIAKGMVDKSAADYNARMKKLEERLSQDDERRRVNAMSGFVKRINENFPGFIASIKADKKAAWAEYQQHNLATIRSAIAECDYDTLAHHIKQFYNSIDVEIPSGGQSGSAAPDPRAMGGGVQRQITGGAGKTYTVQEWCRIKEDAQAKHQDGKISYKDYSDICEELNKAYHEGRVK